MAAQRPVSAATRAIGPHRGMAAPAGRARPPRGDGGRAGRQEVCQDANARTDMSVCNARASARNHLCLWVKTCGPSSPISTALSDRQP